MALFPSSSKSEDAPEREDCLRRAQSYCSERSINIVELRGWGVDAVVWQATDDRILKVFRSPLQYAREKDVYRHLKERKVRKLQGFTIPEVVDFDDDLWILGLTFVRPPYILDFAAATLGSPPSGFDPEDESWQAEQSRKFGRDWPDVKRLLDALRQYGVHYTDVHAQNIRVRL